MGLFSAFQGSIFDYQEAYLAGHRCLEAHWDIEAYVGWFLYAHSGGDVLDISA